MQLFPSQFNLLEMQKKQALKDWIWGQLAELIINCQSSISTEASEQKPQHMAGRDHSSVSAFPCRLPKHGHLESACNKSLGQLM